MSRDKLEFAFIPYLSSTLAFPPKCLCYTQEFYEKPLGVGSMGTGQADMGAWLSSPGSLRYSWRRNTVGEAYSGKIVIRTVMLPLGTRYRLSQCLPPMFTFPYLQASYLAPNLSQDAGPLQKLQRRLLEFRLKWQLGHKVAWKLPGGSMIKKTKKVLRRLSQNKKGSEIICVGKCGLYWTLKVSEGPWGAQLRQDSYWEIVWYLVNKAC